MYTQHAKNKCVICNGDIIGYGHNAQPLAEGICCDKCNMKILMERMRATSVSAGGVSAGESKHDDSTANSNSEPDASFQLNASVIITGNGRYKGKKGTLVKRTKKGWKVKIHDWLISNNKKPIFRREDQMKMAPVVKTTQAFHDLSKVKVFEDEWIQQLNHGEVSPLEKEDICGYINTQENIHPGDIIYVGAGENFSPEAFRPEYQFYYVTGSDDDKTIQGTESFHHFNSEHVIDELNYYFSKEFGRVNNNSRIIKEITTFCQEQGFWQKKMND